MSVLIKLNKMLKTKQNGDNDIIGKMKKHNRNKLNKFNQIHEKIYGHKVSEEAIITLATKRMLDCYNFKEIRNVLEYYEQTGDNR